MAIFLSKYLPKLNQILELDTLFMYWSIFEYGFSFAEKLGGGDS